MGWLVPRILPEKKMRVRANLASLVAFGTYEWVPA